MMATRAGGGPAERKRGDGGEDDTRGVLFWPRGTSRPSSTGSSGTPRRRPRVMMPRPPQSKHASSLPLFAPLLDRSRAVSSFCPAKRSAIRIDIPSQSRTCEITLQRNYIKSEIEISDGKCVRIDL